MSAPANKRLRKTAWHVAVRAVAFRGACEAFPNLSAKQVGEALGLTRHQVRHFLFGDVKSAQNRQPAWSASFFEACRVLATSPQPIRAAVLFERLARELHAGEQQ